MSAEVSPLFRLTNGCKGQAMKGSGEIGKSTALITRDLLGGCCTSTPGCRELDLDPQAPSGSQKRLDLKSGSIYLHRCESPTSSLDQGAATKQSLNLFDETSIDLKLVSSSLLPSLSLSPSPSTSPSAIIYQSVCTLDKVKFALERAERERPKKKRHGSVSDSSNSYVSDPAAGSETDHGEKSPSPSLATGCPNCLLYVLVSVKNPKCPRCNTIISSPFAMKKPRIDLNIPV